MPRLKPLNRADVPECEEDFDYFESRMGFLPNSLLTMARKPNIVAAFTQLAKEVYDPDAGISISLRNLIANMASRSAGCQYCVAHTASNAHRSSVEDQKIAKAWEYETSPLFSDAERAVLRFAQCAAAVPNMADEEVFADLREHYSEEEIVEIMATVAYFGFLNRWNDTMATSLEDIPTNFAENTLNDGTWEAGKHKD